MKADDETFFAKMKMGGRLELSPEDKIITAYYYICEEFSSMEEAHEYVKEDPLVKDFAIYKAKKINI